MPAALTGALATSIALGLAPPTVGAANAASTRAGTSTSSADFFASEIKNINDGPDGSSPGSFAESNGTMFFAAKDADAGRELWKTNGNAGGTTRVKDILPGAGGSYPSNLTDVNGTLFFTATDGSNGYELWKSDGTEAGTVLVKDIRTGASGSNPGSFANVNGTLFFTATDGSNGYELWKSDGTEAGTVLVKDIQSGASGSYPGSLTNVNGTLFFTANDGSTGEQLWKSDGTTAGTAEVKDIGTDGSYPSDLTNVNGTLFFSANDDEYRGYGLPETTGRELWKSDGTAAGTVLVKDINDPPYTGSRCDGSHYPQGSYPSYLTNVNGTLFFVADDCNKGNELWKSNGTEAGTVMVKDNINTGNAYYNYDDGSNPSHLRNVNGTLFFLGRRRRRRLRAVEVRRYRRRHRSGRRHPDRLGPAAARPKFTDCQSGRFLHRRRRLDRHELWESDGPRDRTFLIKDINSGSGGSDRPSPHGLRRESDVRRERRRDRFGVWEAGVGAGPADPTSMDVSCAPASVPTDSTTTCTVTVTSASNATVPTGGVSFFATGPSSLEDVGSCGLEATGVATASCDVMFTPSEAGDWTISGSYFGDGGIFGGGHGGSSDETSVTATPVDTTSTGVAARRPRFPPGARRPARSRSPTMPRAVQTRRPAACRSQRGPHPDCSGTPTARSPPPA